MTNLYCIACPNGCLLTIIGSGADMIVEGGKCSKGTEFAKAELDNPTRTLTTTVRTKFPDVPVISVRTENEIPKHLITDAMVELSRITVEEELEVGDCVLENVAETGVRVIITSPALMQLGAELENKNAELSRASSSGSNEYSTGEGSGSAASAIAATDGVLDHIGLGAADGVVGVAGEAVGVESADDDSEAEDGNTEKGKEFIPQRGRARIQR